MTAVEEIPSRVRKKMRKSEEFVHRLGSLTKA